LSGETVADEGHVPPAPIGFSIRNREPRSLESVGDHDLANRDSTQALFVSPVEGDDVLVVDVSQATFIDSSFLTALVLARKRAAERARAPSSSSDRHRSHARCSRSATSSYLD